MPRLGKFDRAQFEIRREKVRTKLEARGLVPNGSLPGGWQEFMRRGMEFPSGSVYSALLNQLWSPK